MISNLMVSIGNHQNAEIDENMLRHMILNSLRAYRNKFSNKYGEIIICADDKNYWRRDEFPYYKAARKKAREASEMDWNTIFQSLDKIKSEIKEVFPYKVIQIEKAEADDIIGTITHKEGHVLNSGEPILILSGDKDFIQLHVYGNVSQYDPTRNKWVKHSDPEGYLYEHIAKGDASDGVPNVLSPDNTFVIEQRQRPITKKRLSLWKDINNRDDVVTKNWKRNTKLIDLSYIPNDLSETILSEYKDAPAGDRSKLFDYFIQNRLRNLMEHIAEF